MPKKYGYGGSLPAPKKESTPPRGTDIGGKQSTEGPKDLHYDGTQEHK